VFPRPTESAFKVENVAIDRTQWISGGALEMAIYNAAFAIVDARNMLTRFGVMLAWTDCDALRAAIKAHPAYR
jgi:hypothetical protein